MKAFGASRLVRTKTDRVDARLIADYACTNHPPQWQAPSDSEQVLRALVLRVQALQTMRTQESNRLEVARPAVRERIATHLTWLDAEIKALRKTIHQHIDDDPTLGKRQALLDSIPGLGEATIALLLAYAIHPGRFGNARQVAAYAGLDPRQHDSGTSVHQPARLSKI
ncbi:MAG: transposase, partial [Betaproteobacteria bacterium]